MILDNASYHKSPRFGINRSTKKADLVAFLKGQNVKFDEKKLVGELQKLAIKHQKTKVEAFAEECGHRVLFLPPYHLELNPIEYFWSTVKRTVARHAPYDIQKILTEILPMAFSTIAQPDFRKVFDHVRELEGAYRKLTGQESDIIEVQVQDVTEELLKSIRNLQNSN